MSQPLGRRLSAELLGSAFLAVVVGSGIAADEAADARLPQGDGRTSATAPAG